MKAHPFVFVPNKKGELPFCGDCGLAQSHAIHDKPDTSDEMKRHKFVRTASGLCGHCGENNLDPIHDYEKSKIEYTTVAEGEKMRTHRFVPGREGNPKICKHCGNEEWNIIHLTAEDALEPYAKYIPPRSERELTMLDLNANEVVQVQASTNPDGSETLWVNVDGICRLRACRPGQIIINDERKRKK